MILIPFSEFPYFTEEVVLDGASFRFSFLWNASSESWTMGLYDLDGVEIVLGVPMALDQNILKPYRYLAIPAGELWVVDAGGTLSKVGRNDFFEGRVYLAYATLAEIP